MQLDCITLHYINNNIIRRAFLTVDAINGISVHKAIRKLQTCGRSCIKENTEYTGIREYWEYREYTEYTEYTELSK